jgi:modulator of FtsH protease
MEAWHDFFMAEVGASAALVGLLFVSVSLNLEKILHTRGLATRAMLALVLLGAVLVVSSLALIPAQPVIVLGAEVLAVALAVWGFGTVADIGAIRNAAPETRGYFLQHLLKYEITVLPYLVGGALLATGRGGALYWIAAALIASLFTAIQDAWVLLVEINR